MKKFAVVFLVFVVGLAVEFPAVAQSKKSAKEIAKAEKEEAEASAKHKSMDLEGMVQTDGDKTVFLNDRDRQTWKIANPDMLRGHHGMRVKATPNMKEKSLLVDEVKDLKQKQEKPKEEKKKGKRFVIF